MNKYKCNVNCKYDTMVSGNSVNINLNSKNCESEIRADIIVSEYNSVRLWGQVLNCKRLPVENALVKLVKVVVTPKGEKYQGIAHAVTDCGGFYQFDLCSQDRNACYKIIVSKSNMGDERVVDTSNGNCEACSDLDYSVCDSYEYDNCDNYNIYTGNDNKCDTCTPNYKQKNCGCKNANPPKVNKCDCGNYCVANTIVCK